MKILLLTNHLKAGGITTYVFSLAKGLKENGHEVKIASRGGERLYDLKREGIEHILLDISTKSEISPKIFFIKRRLLKILEKERVDILHTQTRLTRLLGQYTKNKLSIPFISTVHGFYKRRFGNWLSPCWGEGVIAISEAVKKALIDKFKLDSQKIRVIYNGVDIERFKIQNPKFKIELMRKLGLSNGPVIGIISRLSDIKGHIYLIRAMKYVLRKISPAQLLIVGEGRMKRSLINLSKDLRIEKSTFFIPSVFDTLDILSVIDVFVMPSLEEGLGLSLIEAMATGIPVVASDVGGIPEIIRDGENGILVPPRDIFRLSEAICRVLKDATLKSRIIQNGRQTVEERFTLDRMVRETEEFYEEIIDKRQGRRVEN